MSTKRKVLYWIFKCASVLIACALPIIAIFEKFPVWTVEHGTKRTVSFGIILITIVILIIFRRAVFNFIRDKFNLQHAPPLMVWLVLLVVSYILVYIGNVMQDMTTVLWMGFIGCAIGNVITYVAENIIRK